MRAFATGAALAGAGVLTLLATLGTREGKGWYALGALAVLGLTVWVHRDRIRDLWLAKIFAAEFGVSDIQANYTRTYAWMANQLGHMTLGMGTALAYVWVVEGVQELFAHLRPGAWTLPVAAWLVSAGLLAVMGFMLSGLRRSKAESAEGIDQTFHGRWTAFGCFTAVLVMGTLGVVYPHPDVARVLGAAFLGLLVLVVLTRRDWGRVDSRGCGDCRILRAVLLATAVLAFAAWYFSIYAFREGGMWPDPQRLEGIVVGLGAAFVSLGVWGAKEFGNDQRGIQAGIRRARTQRGAALPAAQAVADLEAEGLWDSVADGFFYVSGAVVAVGVIASPPRFGTGFVESGWELAAVALFGAIMLILGQRYAYRARALDLIGAPYAFRLGLVESRVRVVQGREHLADAACDLDALYLTLSQLDRRNTPLQIVVYGPKGSGKTPLVVGLACEAALSPLPVSLCERFVAGSEARVKVRYATFRRARQDEARDAVAIRHVYHTRIDNPIFVDGQLLWDMARADLAVIDNIPWNALQLEGGEATLSPALERLVDQVAGRGGSAIWAIDPPGGPEEDAPRKTLSASGGSAAGEALATLRRAAEALAARLAPSKGLDAGAAPLVLVEITDDLSQRCASLEALWRTVNSRRPLDRLHDPLCKGR